MNINITKEDYDNLMTIINLKQTNKDESMKALLFLRDYIEPGAYYCLSCGNAVITLFTRIKSWYNVNKDNLVIVDQLKPSEKADNAAKRTTKKPKTTK